MTIQPHLSSDLPRGTATHVIPKVFIVGETRVDYRTIWQYLSDIGAEDWDFGKDEKGAVVTDADTLIEFAGRLCYKAFGVDLNPNVTRVRNDIRQYITNIIESGHGSVLEHIHINFVFENVSRIFTHEMVRHRHGNFSQESMRYVRLDDLNYRGWPMIYDRAVDLGVAEEVQERNEYIMEVLAGHQKWLADKLKIDDLSFHDKKQITSDMRGFAPHNTMTQIMWTTNFREVRHVITQRTDPGAEWEIRKIFDTVAATLKLRYPIAFADLVPVYAETDTPLNQKVAHWVSSLRDKP